MSCYIKKVWKDGFLVHSSFSAKLIEEGGASVPRTIKTRYCKSEKEGWTEPARQDPVPSPPPWQFHWLLFWTKNTVSTIYLKDISLEMFKFPLLLGRANCDFPKTTKWRYKHSIFIPFKAFRLSLGICLLLFISLKDSKPNCISVFISVQNSFPMTSFWP